MIPSSSAAKNPITTIFPRKPKLCLAPPKLSHFHLRSIQCSFQNENLNTINKLEKPRTHVFGIINPSLVFPQKGNTSRSRGYEEKRGSAQLGNQQLTVLWFGYWMQGFRCFPWLALNFHMAHNLNLLPSILQLVQHSANFPMVAKPFYGVLSDAICIGGAHRIPYILIGVLLQVLSWGPLGLIPLARKAHPTLLACILLGNLGASITEVAKDALVAEYGQKHKKRGLQSYAFMASAVGGILGNLLGGCFLLKMPPKNMFLIFAYLLSVQLAISSTAREESLGLSQLSHHNLAKKSIWENIRKQSSDLKMALHEDTISCPLIWVVGSIAIVPALSGSIFCYQMQCLHLDSSVIGMSRVIGQLMLLSMTILYDCYWKEVPMRKLIGAVQSLYAAYLLLDFVLVRQINLRLGIPNEVFVCCFSGLAETLAQFKLLPFSVLLASLCPKGCEGSLTSLLASALCLSSIFGGFLGVGLASFMGITPGNYSNLPVGILIQFVAALVPLGWIQHIPSKPIVEKERKRSVSKRSRKNRRIGRVVLGSVYVYRRERESETQR